MKAPDEIAFQEATVRARRGALADTLERKSQEELSKTMAVIGIASELKLTPGCSVCMRTKFKSFCSVISSGTR